jgi:Domain of unknown function (DUF1877)
MSIVAVLRSITPEELERSLAHPGWASRLMASRQDPSTAARYCFLEKTQFAIHFLLTGNVQGTDSPLSGAIYGSHELGPMQPRGPIMYLTPEEVRDIASELASTTREEIERRFSPERLSEAGIYPNIWRDDPEALTSVLTDYDNLVAFYARAAGAGEAVVLQIG